MPRHDVAIYAPYAKLYYDPVANSGGGAERQTYLLARSMARRGMRVAHIIYPVQGPVVDPEAPVSLVQRSDVQNHAPGRALPHEMSEIWRALNRADAAVQVFRGATAAVGVAGVWSRLHRRRLIFAGANNADFTLENLGGRLDPRAVMYRAGVSTADTVVVQSGDQVRLARERFPRLNRLEEIPSFVEPAPEAEGAGEAFLWVSRLPEYKRPLLYTDLAAAVPEARFWMIATKSDEPGYETSISELRRRAKELPNLEILAQRSHTELQALIHRAVAMVNTSSFEGMPNTWLEGWARGVPALTLSYDPDGRIAHNGLGISADGSWEDFVAGARSLWARRSVRGGFGPVVRGYVADVHGRRVADRWAALLLA